MTKHNFSIVWLDTGDRYNPMNFSIDGFVMMCRRYPEMFNNVRAIPQDAECGR